MLRSLLASGLVVLAAIANAFGDERGPTPKEVRVDLAGDPLPPGAIARLGTTRYRLRDWGPQSFFFSDGSQLMWMAQDKTFTFIDVETGKATESFSDPKLSSNSRAGDLSPDGRQLAQFGSVRSDKGEYALVLSVYDLKTRATLWSVKPVDAGRSSGMRVKFTPDGRRLLTLFESGDVRVWDAATGNELRREKVPGNPYYFQLSSDGRTLAFGQYDLYVWDSEGTAPPRKIDTGPRRSSFDGLQFSADGKTIYVTSYGGIAPKGYDVATGQMTGRLDLGGRADWFSFSPDGKTVAMGRSANRLDAGDRTGEIILKNLETGKELRRLTADPARPAGALWSKDGSRLMSSVAQRVCVWDVNSGKLLGPDLAGHDGVVSSVVFSPDGRRVFTSGHDRTVRCWDVMTGRQIQVFRLDSDYVPGLAVSQDGSLLGTSALAEDFRVWDAKTGKALFRLIGHGRLGGVRKLRFSADDQSLLSWGDDWYLRSFDALTGKLRSEHRFLGKDLLNEDEEDIRMKLDMSGDDARLAELGANGDTLVLAKGKHVIVYSPNGKERFRLVGDPIRVECLALSPDGKYLATAGHGVEPGNAPVARKPDEPRPDQVTVWDMSKGTEVMRFRVPTRVWWGVLAFTPDGRRVVTGSWDPVLSVWDARTGKLEGTIDLPFRAECVAFDAIAKHAVVGFLDTTALVYDLKAAVKPAKEE